MPLYKLTYEFETSGGNIEYQTTQQVQKEAETHDSDVALVTTGLALENETIDGTAIIEVSDDTSPSGIFESAEAVDQVSPPGDSTPVEADYELTDSPGPRDAISAFEQRDEMADIIVDVNETPGQGFLLHSDLTQCRPHERDLWLVVLNTVELDAESDLTKPDIVQFYRENFDLLEEEPTLKIGGFHGTVDQTIRLSLVASVTDQQEARELAGRAGRSGAVNVYRLELAKGSLVVGAATHGPGQVEAVFSNEAGDEVCTRELAYRRLYEDVDMAFNPLGVLVDGELYRPVTGDGGAAATISVGNPLHVETYRGSDSKPWQFGLTRYEDELLLTQARGPPAKFDPVVKRFPIETRSIGTEPLVFSHTVSRRVWSEDPLNMKVQSQRSEGLRTQFLYADSDSWHLIRPQSLGEPTDSSNASFEPTTLDGVSVRSSLLRATTDGETKATVEHEYRITDQVFSACDRLYALSYHEANEESIERLQWEIADAKAYEIVRDQDGSDSS
jgi:hypothetical protein